MNSVWRWAFALLVLIGQVGQSAQAQTGGRLLVARQVTASTWYVEGESALGSAANRNFISNAGFVITPEGVVVVDALGSPELARELLREIAKITPRKVTHVVVTHYHADHVYGLQVFEEARRYDPRASWRTGIHSLGYRNVEIEGFQGRVLPLGGREYAADIGVAMD